MQSLRILPLKKVGRRSLPEPTPDGNPGYNNLKIGSRALEGDKF